MKLNISVDGKQYEVEVEVAQPEPPAGSIVARPSAPGQSRSTATPTPTSEQFKGDEAKVVRSPLAGVVSKVGVGAGQEVEPDQEILVLEAMKMFTTITSPRKGRVREVLVAQGDAVKQGQILLEFE